MIKQLQGLLHTLSPEYDYSDANDLPTMIECLEDIILDNPTKSLENFDNLVSVIASADQGNSEVASSLLKVAITIISSFKKKFSQSSNYDSDLTKIIEIIIKLIASIPRQINQSWANPAQGYSLYKDNEDNCQTQDLISKQALNSFDILAKYIGFNKISQITNKICSQIIELDWRNQYAALMAFSQIGQYAQKVEMIKEYVFFTVKSMKSNNPKIRYASLHAIGQWAQDMKPQFQLQYNEILLPVILEAINDSVNRVCSHALACLANFLQQFEDFNKISEIMPFILKKSYAIMENKSTPSYVNENNLTVIASLCELENLLNTQSINIIINILAKANQRYGQLNQFIQIRGVILQVLSFMISYQTNLTEKYCLQCLELIQSITDKKAAPFKYIQNCWSMIFANRNDLPDRYMRVTAKLLLYYPQIEKQGIEKEGVISTIGNIIRSFGIRMKPLMPEILEFIKNEYKNSDDNSIKMQVIKIYEICIQSFKPSTQDQFWKNLLKGLFLFTIQEINNYISLTQYEDKIELFIKLIKLLISLIDCLVEIFNSEELLSVCQQIFTLVPQIENLYASQKKVLQELQEESLNSSEYDESQQLQEISNSINDIRFLIPDLVQALVKIIPGQAKIVVINKVLIQIGQIINNANENCDDLQYGLYFIDNLLQVLDHEILFSYWDKLNEVLSKFSTHPDKDVRNPAIFGLGILISKTPIKLVNHHSINAWIQIIKESLKVPKREQRLKDYLFVQQNVISTLGKFLKAFRRNFDLRTYINEWFVMLPLNHDKDQGNIQCEFLIQLLDTDPSLIIQSKQSLLQVLKIHAKFLSKRKDKKYQKQQKLVKQSIIKMQVWPLFAHNGEFLWNSLTKDEKSILKKICQ